MYCWTWPVSGTCEWGKQDRKGVKNVRYGDRVLMDMARQLNLCLKKHIGAQFTASSPMHV